MSKTSTRVSFGLYDLVLKDDSTLTCPDLQSFSKLLDLARGSASYRPYASFEPDFWLLDGQYKFLPENDTTVHVGLMSLSMSGADGAFITPPILTITFGEPHTIESLSLIFAPYSGDYANSVTIAYYDASNTLIRTDNYAPGSPEFTTHQAVANFKKILITFHSTNRPYRYLRLASLDYGELIIFSGSAIKEAMLVEEVDQLSAVLPFNVLDLSLYSADSAFSILNPTGNYATLNERQPLDVYETVDNASTYIGRFYLDQWSNLSDTDYKFHATDLLGILDRQTYLGGLWNGITLENLLEEVLAPIHAYYELDNQLIDTTVKGWLPVCTYREALQQIGFAVGASITCSRSGVLKIFASKIANVSESETTITKAQKGQSQELTLKPLVTGINVTAHNYIPGGESQVIASGQYETGIHEIIFTDPMHALSVSGATIIDSGVNYAILAVTISGTVTLTGLKYIDTIAVTNINLSGLPANTTPNVLKIEDATLVNAENVSSVAQRTFDYYQQRYQQTVRLYAPSIEPGSVITIDTLYNKQLLEVIEKMESNLAMGFTSNVKMTGVENVA